MAEPDPADAGASDHSAAMFLADCRRFGISLILGIPVPHLAGRLPVKELAALRRTLPDAPPPAGLAMYAGAPTDG